MRRQLLLLSKKYIRNTEKDSVIQLATIFLCHLTSTVSKQLRSTNKRVYINTRVVKHVYDKRPAEEYDFLINQLHAIIQHPDVIYLNKPDKKGDFCFVKKIKNHLYLCSLENKNNEKYFEVVTFFRVQKEAYLTDYKLLWEWKGGAPSS